MDTVETANVELSVRVELCHAALQHIARLHGVDLLHIKGMAFDARWRSRPGGGTDADVLVRPSQVNAFTRLLQEQGWHRHSSFRTGSASGHAETYWHDHLGYADVHRFFMGMGRDEETFDVLWSRRSTVTLASVDCPVPDAPAQALIFAINEARNSTAGLVGPSTVTSVTAGPFTESVTRLVPRVRAEVGWAAARGALGEVRHHPEHDLWVVTLAPRGRVAEWRARVRAEPTLREKILTVLRAPLVNMDHLTNVRGHRPSPSEVAREFVDRAWLGVREVWGARPTRRSHE